MKLRSLIRPFLVFSFVIYTGWCIYKGEVTGKEVFQFMMIMGSFYFAERSALKKPGEKGDPPANN